MGDAAAAAAADWWLVCNNAAPFLVARFDPGALCMARATGRVYHSFDGFETLATAADARASRTSKRVSASGEAVARAVGGVALVRSALAQELSPHFRWEEDARGPGHGPGVKGPGAALDAQAAAEETHAMLAERGPPTHFLWGGRLHALDNELWQPRVAAHSRASKADA